MRHKGIFHNKAFVVEAQGEKKRVIGLTIANGGGIVCSYSKINNLTSKGFKGFLVAHHSLFKKSSKVEEVARQCEQHQLVALRSEYIDYAVSHRSGNVIPKFIIAWGQYIECKALEEEEDVEHQEDGSEGEESTNKEPEQATSETDSDTDDVTFNQQSPNTRQEDSNDERDGDMVSNSIPQPELLSSQPKPSSPPSTQRRLSSPIISPPPSPPSTPPKRPAAQPQPQPPATAPKRPKPTPQLSPTNPPATIHSSTNKSQHNLPTTTPSYPSTITPRSPSTAVPSNSSTTTSVTPNFSSPTTIARSPTISTSTATSTASPERPQTALKATPRRASERIRPNITYYKPLRSAKKSSPPPPASKTKTRITRSTRVTANSRVQEDNEEEKIDVDTEETRLATATPAELRTKPLPVPDTTAESTIPNKTPKRATKTPKSASKKSIKTPKTTAETSHNTTMNTTTTTATDTTTKTKSTPKATPKLTPAKVLSKTPKTRLTFNEETDDPLQYIMHNLAHDAGELIEITGRESEFSQLVTFCKDCITSHKPGSAYLCGKPGTGKTLTVSTAVTAVSQWARNSSQRKIDVIKVNCTQVADPKAIYRSILEKSRRYAGGLLANAERELEGILFSNGPMTLIVLDEIDQLMNQQSGVLYHLFEWCSAANSNLILIGIANTIDLVQRFLPLLTRGDIAPVIIPYKPYSYSQLVSVITTRVAKADIIEHKAIEACARKVASIDGDVRKALDICVDAAKSKQVQVGTSSGSKRITTGDMMAAIARNYPVETVDQIKKLPLHYQLVLCGAIVLTHSFSQDELHQSYMSICKTAGFSPTSKSEFTDIVSGLAGYNLLHKTQKAKLERISVPVAKEDLLEGMDSSLQSIKAILADGT